MTTAQRKLTSEELDYIVDWVAKSDEGIGLKQGDPDKYYAQIGFLVDFLTDFINQEKGKV